MQGNLKWQLCLLSSILGVIYCDKAWIKDKSDIPCTSTFIYLAVQNTCLLTEVMRGKRVNHSFSHWSDIIKEFHSKRITCYDDIVSTHLNFFKVSLQNNRVQISVYRSIFCGGLAVRADPCNCPALSCSVEFSRISRFLWFSVRRIGPCSGSLYDFGLCSSSLFCDEGVQELSSAASIFQIFSRSLWFRRGSVQEIVNTVDEHGATSVYTMLVSCHIFFMGSRIRTGSPGFNNSKSIVPRLLK